MARRRRKPDQRVLGYDLKDPEQKQELVDHIAKEVAGGKNIQEALDVPQELLDNVYALAYEKYQKGEYEKASNFFRYLVIFNEKRYEYLLGLAASLHKQGEFDEASRIYLLAAIHRPDDPVPSFHGADCYLKLGDIESARAALNLAILVSGTEEKYAELKARAELTVKNLKD